jgi:TPR repeat protein
MSSSLESKIRELVSRAKNGDVTAPYRLGKLYLEAGRNEDDLKNSIIWFKKAIKIDCIPAYFELANIYLKGLGTRPNRKKGFEYMLLSGKKYDQRAFYPLYELYLQDKNDRENQGK